MDRDTGGANRQVNCPIPAKLLYAARYQNRYMDGESADRTRRSIDRFIESGMIVSQGFMISARKMFGDGYKATIRNLTHEYEKQVIKYPAGDTNRADMVGVKRLQLPIERGANSEDTKVKLVKFKLILTTKHGRHHLGKGVCEDRHLCNQGRSRRNSRNRSVPERNRSDRFGQAQR